MASGALTVNVNGDPGIYVRPCLENTSTNAITTFGSWTEYDSFEDTDVGNVVTIPATGGTSLEVSTETESSSGLCIVPACYPIPTGVGIYAAYPYPTATDAYDVEGQNFGSVSGFVQA